jgi:thymidine phosphorylase
LIELTLDLAVKLVPVPRDQLHKNLNDGRAWEKFVGMVEAQGGDASALEKIREVHRAPFVADLVAPSSGTLSTLDAREIGRLCVELGAGRAKTGDAIDYAVGIECLGKQGEQVSAGQPLVRVHSRQPVDLSAVAARILAVA